MMIIIWTIVENFDLTNLSLIDSKFLQLFSWYVYFLSHLLAIFIRKPILSMKTGKTIMLGEHEWFTKRASLPALAASIKKIASRPLPLPSSLKSQKMKIRTTIVFIPRTDSYFCIRFLLQYVLVCRLLLLTTPQMNTQDFISSYNQLPHQRIPWWIHHLLC